MRKSNLYLNESFQDQILKNNKEITKTYIIHYKYTIWMNYT